MLMMVSSEEKLSEIRQLKEKWEKETVIKSFDKLPEKSEYTTSSDTKVERIYVIVLMYAT